MLRHPGPKSPGKPPPLRQGHRHCRRCGAAAAGAVCPPRRTAALEEAVFQEKARSLAGTGDVLLIEEEMPPESVRKLCDAVAACCGGRCAVFAGTDGNYKYAISQPGGDLRQLTKELNAALHGRGGGKPAFVQGSAACSAAELRPFSRAGNHSRFPPSPPSNGDRQQKRRQILVICRLSYSILHHPPRAGQKVFHTSYYDVENLPRPSNQETRKAPTFR